jgi:hypothetical protein
MEWWGERLMGNGVMGSPHTGSIVSLFHDSIIPPSAGLWAGLATAMMLADLAEETKLERLTSATLGVLTSGREAALVPWTPEIGGSRA